MSVSGKWYRLLGGVESMDDLQCWSDACYPGLPSKEANAPSLGVPMCVASGAWNAWNPGRSEDEDGWPTNSTYLNYHWQLIRFRTKPVSARDLGAKDLNRLRPARNTNRPSNTAVTPVRHQLEYGKS